MNWGHISFDWNRARAFLATVEEGSLSAAARALGQTQPTLGRQITALEDELGVVLFERVGRSVELTPTGRELVPHLRQMRDAAADLALKVTGQSNTIEGTVCITVSDIFAISFMSEIIKDIRATAPKLQIEILATNNVQDLQRREADIAIRHVRPTQRELITRLVHEAKAHLYGATTYLNRVGRPNTKKDLEVLDFVGFGSPEETAGYWKSLGVTVEPDQIKVTSANALFAWKLVCDGFGIAAMGEIVGDRTEGLERVLPDMDPIGFPVWLTTHRELHSSKRIRLVYDILAKHLSNPEFWAT